MKKTRVLVVDDSVIIRRLLSSILAEDPTIEVVGVAANDRIALQKMDHLQPDMVTLDVSMPDMIAPDMTSDLMPPWYGG